MKNLFVIILLMLIIPCKGQHRKDSTVYLKYDEPKWYLEKAGRQGMTAIFLQGLSVVTYLAIYENPEFKEPWKILAAGSIGSSILTVCAFRNIQHAGLAIIGLVVGGGLIYCIYFLICGNELV